MMMGWQQTQLLGLGLGHTTKKITKAAGEDAQQ
jgi:hypothetical protein